MGSLLLWQGYKLLPEIQPWLLASYVNASFYIMAILMYYLGKSLYGNTRQTTKYAKDEATIDLERLKERSDLVVELTSPYSITKISDGGIYKVNAIKLKKPNLFTQIGYLKELVMKVPSDRGRTDFAKFVKLGLTDPEDIRSPEGLECFENLEEALRVYPEFATVCNIFGGNVAHYLVVHKIQYERLLKSTQLISIPKTRFIVLTQSCRSSEIYATPAVVQEHIRGIRLFDMVNNILGKISYRYRHLKRELRDEIEPLVNSDISIHIDWNIQNFVWNKTTKRLYYVDCKPTLLVAKFSVNDNLAAIRKVFLS